MFHTASPWKGILLSVAELQFRLAASGQGPDRFPQPYRQQVRRIFGPKMDVVTGEWRELHNEELRDLYSSPSIIGIIKSRRMRWVGHVARMGEKRNAYRLLAGKPEGKRPLGRPRRRWVDNIRMGLGRGGMR
jgi:hypothetical protein